MKNTDNFDLFDLGEEPWHEKPSKQEELQNKEIQQDKEGGFLRDSRRIRSIQDEELEF